MGEGANTTAVTRYKNQTILRKNSRPEPKQTTKSSTLGEGSNTAAITRTVQYKDRARAILQKRNQENVGQPFLCVLPPAVCPKGQACFANGLCLDGVSGTGTCRCNKEFNGTACETCQSGKYGVQCDQAVWFSHLDLNVSVLLDLKEMERSVKVRTTTGHSSSADCLGIMCLIMMFAAVDPCLGNSGCHLFAQCNMTGPGVRSCTCAENYVGDGFKCKSTVDKELRHMGSAKFYFSLMIMDITLKGRGPFTVFVPSTQATKNTSLIRVESSFSHKETFANLLRNHIVMCHTLLPDDLNQPRNLTSLSGLGAITINEANVTKSDDISVNGIIHEIDTDTGVMDLINDAINQPVTIFMPSDDAMASLPQQQKDFLFHQHNRPQLLEYLKYHIMMSQKGEIYVNDGSCRIIQRHLVFKAGIAYGIDCLLIPPSLGGRCDEQTFLDLKAITSHGGVEVPCMNCGPCRASDTLCPRGTIKKVRF
ncbi:hypothetical protein XENOCAPTIV_022000, partial [Xenoophorus captivus]